MSFVVQKYKVKDQYTSSLSLEESLLPNNLKKIALKYSNQYHVYDQYNTQVSGVIVENNVNITESVPNFLYTFQNYFLKLERDATTEEGWDGVSPAPKIEYYEEITEKTPETVQIAAGLLSTDISNLEIKNIQKANESAANVIEFKSQILDRNKEINKENINPLESFDIFSKKTVLTERDIDLEKINLEINKSQIIEKTIEPQIYPEINKQINLCNLNNFKLNVEYRQCDDPIFDPLPPKIWYKYITYYIIKWIRIVKIGGFGEIIVSKEPLSILPNPSSSDLDTYFYIYCGVVGTTREAVIAS